MCKYQKGRGWFLFDLYIETFIPYFLGKFFPIYTQLSTYESYHRGIRWLYCLEKYMGYKLSDNVVYFYIIPISNITYIMIYLMFRKKCTVIPMCITYNDDKIMIERVWNVHICVLLRNNFPVDWFNESFCVYFFVYFRRLHNKNITNNTKNRFMTSKVMLAFQLMLSLSLYNIYN